MSLLFQRLKHPSHRQKTVHSMPLWQHSQYFFRHFVFLHLHPLRTSSCCTPKLKPLFSFMFQWLASWGCQNPWVSVWAFRARASMMACWCSSLLEAWLPQLRQLQVFEQKVFFWKHSQQSFRHLERLQLQPALLACPSSSSRICGMIMILRELLESLLSENQELESLMVWLTEKLSSNFFLKDLRKDSESTECSFSILSSPLQEFSLEESSLMEEGISFSLELELLRIFLKSERRLSCLQDREWVTFSIFSISISFSLRDSMRNSQKMSFLCSGSSSSIISGLWMTDRLTYYSIFYIIPSLRRFINIKSRTPPKCQKLLGKHLGSASP